MLLILAQTRERADLEAISQYVTSGEMDWPWHWLLIGVGFLLALFSIMSLIRLHRSGAWQRQTLLLAYQVAQQIGLRLRDMWLLYRIARQQQLPSPLTLMFSADTLEHHARDFTRGHPPGRQKRIMRQVERIQRVIFEIR